MEKIILFLFSIKKTKTDMIFFTKKSGVIYFLVLVILGVLLAYSLALSNKNLPELFNIFLFTIATILLIATAIFSFFMFSNLESSTMTLREVATKIQNSEIEARKGFRNILMMSILRGQLKYVSYTVMDFPFYDPKVTKLQELDATQKEKVTSSMKNLTTAILSHDRLASRTMMDLCDLNLTEQELNLIKSCRSI